MKKTNKLLISVLGLIVLVTLGVTVLVRQSDSQNQQSIKQSVCSKQNESVKGIITITYEWGE
jgi:hypothetical protein